MIYFIFIRASTTEVKSTTKHLVMAWIDYKKAYDMVPHLWIKECLDLFGVAENINSLLVNKIKTVESNVVRREFRVGRS